MKRSIMLMGGNTYVISLPAGWVKRHGLEKGQEIEVTEDIGKVVISASLKPESKMASIEYEKGDNEKLIKAYQMGYDEIKVAGSISLDSLQQVINEFLPGFEIIASGKGYCMLKSVSEPSRAELDALIRRAFLLMSGEGRKSALRIISMCKRCIAKNGYKGFSQSLVAYSILCDMEKAAEEKGKKGMEMINARYESMAGIMGIGSGIC
ncbi:MAG: AbrB/MazE/SpoVT family DNA-binding domain-containing protein [Nanoarchaeota archaeon]|nr:AbrB/MazE/SpoVT family DNA-binding domain-containing protein [Nanoarchaeota archaeon]